MSDVSKEQRGWYVMPTLRPVENPVKFPAAGDVKPLSADHCPTCKVLSVDCSCEKES